MKETTPRIPPRNDDELLAFTKNFIQYTEKQISASPSPWPHVNTAALAPITAAFGTFTAQLTAYRTTRTPENRTRKDGSKTALRAVITVFLNDYVRKNSHITADNLIALWMHVPRERVKVIAAPEIECVGDIDFPGLGLIRVHNFHPARPGDAREQAALYGVNIAYGILGPQSGTDRLRLKEVPRTGADLPHHIFTRKKHLILNLQEESGNKLYICFRYENSKGDPGPWGPVCGVNIP